MSRFYQIPIFILHSLTSLFFSIPFHLTSQSEIALSKPLIKIWVFDSTDLTEYTPTVNQDLIFLPLTTGTLVALSKNSGTLQWRSEIGGDISAPPISDGLGVYVATEISSAGKGSLPTITGTLRSIGKQSGLTMWIRALPAPIRTTLTKNHNTIFAGTIDGKLYAINKSTGEINWLKNSNSPFTSHPVLSGNRLYIGDEAGTLHAVEITSGRTIWRYRTRGALRAPVAINNGLVVVGSSDSSVYALSEMTGRSRWRSRTGAGIQSLTATSRCLLVTSLDNFVYCLSIQSGSRIWKRQLSGRIPSQPLVTSDGILFAPLAGDECIVLDLSEGKKINSINVGDDNNTAASPIHAGNIILITTRKGLIAYSNTQ
jgi:outer membrane protein assembly factor BamB